MFSASCAIVKIDGEGGSSFVTPLSDLKNPFNLLLLGTDYEPFVIFLQSMFMSGSRNSNVLNTLIIIKKP